MTRLIDTCMSSAYNVTCLFASNKDYTKLTRLLKAFTADF